MSIFVLPFAYIKWHYSQAISDIWEIYKNLLAFIARFFSLKLLLRTLFSPWRRITEEKNGKRTIGEFFGDLVINTLMRFIGFFIRLFTILLGTFVWIIGAWAGLLFFVAWILLPAIAIVLLLAGIGGLMAK